MSKNNKFSKEQNDAADPLKNVWVQANAGTGKTAVLVRRLLRILFKNRLKKHLKPYGILCLTYTNAAAGEMKNRILDALSQWASLNDDELKQLLLEIVSESNITEEDILYARQVFFFYIDHSEMLKIKTIHGFCEEILRDFPVEAGINPNWTLVSDSAQKILLQETLKTMMFKSSKNEDYQSVTNAFSKIIETSSEHYLDKLLQILTDQYKQFFQISNIKQYKNYFTNQLKSFLNITEDIDFTFQENDLRQIIDLAQADIKKLNKTAPKYLNDIVTLTRQYIDNAIDFNKYKTAYLTANNDPIVNVSKKEYCTKEQNRVFVIQQYILNNQIYENTMALFDLVVSFATTYKQIKQELFLLDFDDLILYTRHLFSNPAVMGTVLKKIDTKLEHILVDEAQDTSPQQWDIIKMLVEDFFIEGTDYKNKRSMFVVGDIKQSIYGFQGADPTSFISSKQEISTNIINNSNNIVAIPLETNFRSAQAILQTVDFLFKHIQIINNKYYHNIQHNCSRLQDEGLVEVYPLKSNDSEYQNRIKEYIYNISQKIKLLIDTEKYNPEDIMVLVQNRKPFATPLTTELKRIGIKVAGNDRITLPNYPVVKDLLNILRLCINQNDDYVLCCLLKSPFYRLKEQDILKICNIKQASKTNQNLLHVLSTEYTDIYNDINDTMENFKNLSAFSFFNYILNKNNNRQKLISALGNQIIDPLEEFLNICLTYEKTRSGTLTQFLKWFVLGDNEIKRDMNSTNGVRIMTVHGSKGLDSKVVFLIDTVSTPKQNSISIIDTQKYTNYKTWIWLENQPKTHALNQAKQLSSSVLYEEYYRLLYVAMTRARDRLYIYGCETTPIQEISWYTQIQSILSTIPGSNIDNEKISLTNYSNFN